MPEARNTPFATGFEFGSYGSPENLEQLARQYQTDRFVPLDGFLTPDQAAALLAATRDTPSRRVICGLEHVSWDEQNFEPGHPAYDFFTQPEQVRLIQALTGRNVVSGLTCWTSGYKAGEYINPHRDGQGTIQLLVCLQAPSSPANGGTLVVAGRELFLTPGAAIAFEATSLDHSTTPLVASEDEPDPRRTVLVGRYFMGERLPRVSRLRGGCGAGQGVVTQYLGVRLTWSDGRISGRDHCLA